MDLKSRLYTSYYIIASVFVCEISGSPYANALLRWARKWNRYSHYQHEDVRNGGEKTKMTIFVKGREQKEKNAQGKEAI